VVSDSSYADVDIVATLRAAAINAAVNGRDGKSRVEEDDLRIRVRKAKLPRLTVIVLDASGSMVARRITSIAKSVAAKLIENSYVKRDYLALIVFRGISARVVVSLTKRYSGVMEVLESVRVGGRTPLSSALQTLLFTAKAFKKKNRDYVVRGILITDGKANCSLYSKPIKEELLLLASALKKVEVRVEIYDSRDVVPSYINLLSSALNARVYTV